MLAHPTCRPGRVALPVLISFVFAVQGWLPAALGSAPAPTFDELLARRTQLYDAFQKYEKFKHTTEATTIAGELATLERELISAALAETPPQPNRVRVMRLALAQTLEWLVKRHKESQQLAGAEKCQSELIQVLSELYGADDYRTRDAEMNLRNLKQLRTLLVEKPDQVKEVARLNDLLKRQCDEGNLTEAITTATTLLKARINLLGKDHPDVILLASELGYLHFMVGNFQEAEEISKQAVTAWKQLLGEDHPQYGSSLANLGMLYMQMGQPAGAEMFFRQSAEVFKKALGERDPQYARAQVTLAELYQTMGMAEQAEEGYRIATDIYREVYGQSNREYLACLCKHGLTLAELGQLDLAQDLVMQSLELRQHHLGAEHPDTIRNIFNLGDIYMAQGQRAKAEPLFLQALKLWKKTLGERDPHYRIALERLAEFYRIEGNEAKYNEYLSELKRVVELPPLPDEKNPGK